MTTDKNVLEEGKKLFQEGLEVFLKLDKKDMLEEFIELSTAKCAMRTIVRIAQEKLEDGKIVDKDGFIEEVLSWGSVYMKVLVDLGRAVKKEDAEE